MTTEKQQESSNRIIKMNDGTTQDFGVRNNTVQEVDFENKRTTFKVITGETISIEWSKIPEELKEKLFVYGLSAKVKSSVAGVKAQEANEEGVIENILAATIEETLNDIKAGKLSTRNSSGDEEEVLDESVKLFAVAAACFDKYPYFNPDFTEAVKQEGDWLLFNEEASQEVIKKISDAWEALDRKQRHAAKKDQHYRLVEGYSIQALFAKAKQA